jgi:hypothetical protein
MKRIAVFLLVAIGAPRIVDAEPSFGRLVTAPTAWMPPAGALVGTAGLDIRSAAEDKRLDGNLLFGYALGELAHLELGAESDVRACRECDGDPLPAPRWLGRAAFRIGARQDRWFAGQPALVLGVRTTFAAASTATFDRPRVSEAYVVASHEMPGFAGYIVRLHGGVTAIDAGHGDLEMGPKLRPLGGVELVAPQYPRTTVLADFTYVALLQPQPRVEWVVGWGVRYQALRWGSIELLVRHREDEGLSASTVMMRVNGVWGAKPEKKASDQPMKLN